MCYFLLQNFKVCAVFVFNKAYICLHVNVVMDCFLFCLSVET